MGIHCPKEILTSTTRCVWGLSTPGWLSPTLEHVHIAGSFAVPRLTRRVAFVERVLGGAVASHGLLLSSEADPEVALAFLERPRGAGVIV